MCLAALHGQFHAAYAFNRGLFLALPFLAIVLGIVLYRYVWGVKGKGISWKIQHWLSFVLLGWILAWCVIRNLLHM